ncbi:hypothetical protein [uncultured Flavobacterium sp.]|uniref:hypothetical protein n=1 Tax=uncultured Flavobacterium sp. TaxID=165435 RepID=UPI0029317F80|nr:hypothetical protein [uncultured Flavobacterium sp.]
MEKSFVYNDGCSADLEKEDELYFTFGIFIDGNPNNETTVALKTTIKIFTKTIQV